MNAILEVFPRRTRRMRWFWVGKAALENEIGKNAFFEYIIKIY